MEVKRYGLLLGFISLVIAIPIAMPYASDESAKTEYETGVYYKIRRGDTLWDISERFYDTPSLWPELWKDNRQIPNPHWIYPGDRIRLHRDISDFDWTSPVTVTEPEVETPSPAVVESTLEEPPEPAYVMFNAMDRIGYIKNSPLKASATIFKSQDDRQLIRSGDTVYLRKLEDDSFEPGTRFTIYRTLRHTRLQDSDFSGGIQHYLVGIAQITVNRPDYAVATIIRAYRSVQKDDLLIPFEERSPKITLRESRDDVRGRIICSEENEEIMGEHTIAFIDKGEQNGMIPGQTYSLFYQETMRLSTTSPDTIPLTPIDIGTIFIIHTETNTATVMITNAKRAILPGAMFRTPKAGTP